MKKRTKFDGGGSVMDRPSRDMRDPAYRRELERKQALETSAPEFAVVGPAGAARTALKNVLSRSAKPAKSLTKNITIGQNVGKPGQAISKDLRDALREIERSDEISRAIVGRTAKSLGLLAMDIPAPEAARQGRPEGATEGYKKGGKVSSASSRGDGIAQRGKTKGRMV